LGVPGVTLHREREAASAADAPTGATVRDDERSVPGVHTVEPVRELEGDIQPEDVVVT